MHNTPQTAFAIQIRDRFAALFCAKSLELDKHYTVAEHTPQGTLEAMLLGDAIHDDVALNIKVSASERTVTVALVDKSHRRPPLMLRSTPLSLKHNQTQPGAILPRSEQVLRRLLRDTERRLDVLRSPLRIASWDALSQTFPTTDTQE